MNHSPRPRKATELSDAMRSRLDIYALAASAAGVGILTLAQPAEAKIVYTRAHHTISPKTHFDLDLNHDGTTDFTISNVASRGVNDSFGTLAITAASRQGNAFVGYKFSSRSFASALPAGVKIGRSSKFESPPVGVMEQALRNTDSFLHYGPWFNVRARYLGLRFVVKGRTHYGWARLNVSCAKAICTALLTGYAYETIADRAILAGKTHGPARAVEPATLGHLAQGASAVPAWRLKQTAGTVPSSCGRNIATTPATRGQSFSEL